MQDQQTPSQTTSRRSFLEKIFAATVVAVAAPSVVLGRIVPELRASKGALAGRYRIDLTKPEYSELTTVGGSIRLDSIAGATFSVIVTRIEQATFAAVNATCTHEGCTVSQVTPDSDGELVCPCHGSRYTPTGIVRRGPAPRALKAYATFFDGGTTLEIEIEGIASTSEEIALGAFVGTPFVDAAADRVILDVALEAGADVRAGIYATSGALVADVLDGRLAAGRHELRGSISALASGAYLLRVENGGRSVISRPFVVSR
jgi:Rieske Fe-S protein